MKRIAASLLFVLACKTSASYASGSGTTAPDGQGKPPQQVPAGDAGATSGTTPGGGGSGAATPAPVACVPALGDQATSLFAGRVVVKLPKGVEMVEQNPFVAVAASPQSTTSCGAVVSYVSVGFFQYPGSTSITAVRDHLLELRGIPPETIVWADEGTRGRNYTAEYTAPADEKTGAPETRGWLVLRDAPNDKYLYYAMYEADPAAFVGLRPLFQDSGRRLLVKPKALQAGDVVETKPDTSKPVTPPKSKVKAKTK